MEINYIDIHTHHSYKPTDDVIFIRQAYMHPFIPEVKNYFVSKGLHPWYIEQKFDEDFFIELLSNPKVLAIGECGLDRLKPQFNLQIDVFKKQFEIANQLGKPMILHIVKAYDEIELLVRKSKVPVILHQYLGNEIQTNKLLANELIYFSFGKNLNQPKSILTLNQIPLNRIFLETDITSKNIKDVYLEFANLRQLDLIHLKQILYLNFEKVFGLIP
ncbi:MAG: TatD family hydrolase [Bacteroidia bacterium]